MNMRIVSINMLSVGLIFTNILVNSSAGASFTIDPRNKITSISLRANKKSNPIVINDPQECSSDTGVFFCFLNSYFGENQPITLSWPSSGYLIAHLANNGFFVGGCAAQSQAPITYITVSYLKNNKKMETDMQKLPCIISL